MQGLCSTVKWSVVVVRTLRFSPPPIINIQLKINFRCPSTSGPLASWRHGCRSCRHRRFWTDLDNERRPLSHRLSINVLDVNAMSMQRPTVQRSVACMETYDFGFCNDCRTWTRSVDAYWEIPAERMLRNELPTVCVKWRAFGIKLQPQLSQLKHTHSFANATFTWKRSFVVLCVVWIATGHRCWLFNRRVKTVLYELPRVPLFLLNAGRKIVKTYNRR